MSSITVPSANPMATVIVRFLVLPSITSVSVATIQAQASASSKADLKA